jgi:hypothetical protein
LELAATIWLLVLAGIGAGCRRFDGFWLLLIPRMVDFCDWSWLRRFGFWFWLGLELAVVDLSDSGCC